MNICQLFGKEQRQKSTLSLLVAVHAGGRCAIGCSSELREMAFEICIRLSKWSHIFIDMIIPTIPGGESYILAQINQPPMEVIQQFQRGNCAVNK